MNQINGPYHYLSPYYYLPQQISQFIPNQSYWYLPVVPNVFNQQPLTVENYRRNYHPGDSFTYSNAYTTFVNPHQALADKLIYTVGEAARTILNFKGKS